MRYERFEQLPVWQAGMTLAERVFKLTADRAFNFQGDLRSQLQRAALSVSNNVAEGWADSLQNSPISGQRYLTEKTQRSVEQKRRPDAFLES